MPLPHDMLICFSHAEWKAWTRASYHCRPDARDYACADCTPEFKARMLAERKCMWPCVQFVTEEDGGIRGIRMSLLGVIDKTDKKA